MVGVEEDECVDSQEPVSREEIDRIGLLIKSMAGFMGIDLPQPEASPRDSAIEAAIQRGPVPQVVELPVDNHLKRQFKELSTKFQNQSQAKRAQLVVAPRLLESLYKVPRADFEDLYATPTVSGEVLDRRDKFGSKELRDWEQSLFRLTPGIKSLSRLSGYACSLSAFLKKAFTEPEHSLPDNIMESAIDSLLHLSMSATDICMRADLTVMEHRRQLWSRMIGANDLEKAELAKTPFGGADLFGGKADAAIKQAAERQEVRDKRFGKPRTSGFRSTSFSPAPVKRLVPSLGLGSTGSQPAKASQPFRFHRKATSGSTKHRNHPRSGISAARCRGSAFDRGRAGCG